MVDVTRPIGTCESVFGLEDYLAWRPWYGAKFRSYPNLPELMERLGAGDAPAPGHYDRDRRLQQLRDDGIFVPPTWADRRATFGETEIGAVLEYSGLVWWSEVVAPGPPRKVPWRLDYLALARTTRVPHGLPSKDDLLKFRPHKRRSDGWWKLVGIEIDGPQHAGREQYDLERDAFLFRTYGVEIYRVPADWARVDPWATVSAVLDEARVLRSPDGHHRGLGHPSVYVCELCNGPIQRRDPCDLVASRGHVAHGECYERESRYGAPFGDDTDGDA